MDSFRKAVFTLKNIVLIGMPGAGKSTVGVVLAKVMQMDFCDTDLLIQKQTGCALQKILDTNGLENFLQTESSIVSALECDRCVIATGGSVVLSENAMEHLKRIGTVVYLRVSFEAVQKRIHNLATRGIAFSEGQTLSDIYMQRVPLYEKFADITVECSELDCRLVVERIRESFSK